MNKTRVCVTKTINLAKDTCIKKTNLLVYEKTKDDPATPKPQPPCSGTAPHVCVPNAKQIRICTGAEMKKMCKPRICACPPPPQPTWVGIARIVGTAVKLVIVGSLAYWTVFIGMWGDCESTAQLYYRWCKAFTGKECEVTPVPPPPYISAVCEEQMKMVGHLYTPAKDRCSNPPVSLEESMFSLKERWNRMVTTSFDMLLHFPSYCTAFMDKLANINNPVSKPAKEDDGKKSGGGAPAKDEAPKKCTR